MKGIFTLFAVIFVLAGCQSTTSSLMDDVAPARYEDAGMQTFLAKDSNITYIGRWIDTTTEGNPIKVSLSAGMRLRLKFTGTSLSMNFNPLTAYISEVEYQVDNNGWGRANAVGTVVLASGLADTEHTLEIYTASMRGWYRWINLDGVRIQSINVDTGKTLSPWPTGLPKMLTLGDSIASGDLVLPDGATSGRLSLSNQLAASLGYENWNVVAGGTGFYGTQPANGFPATQENYPYKCSGVPHNDPSFDLVFIEAIQNDGTANRYTEYTTLLTRLHADQPGVPIICLGLIFPEPQEQSSVQSVAAAYGATYISTSTWVYSHPQAIHEKHPDVAGAAAIAAYIKSTVESVKSTKSTMSTMSH